MAKKSIETLVGMFVLFGILALVFLALKAANLGSFSIADTYTVTARFDNIGGLKQRAPVRSAGVTVGRVTDIGLDEVTYQGVVTMEIQREFEFPQDTSAKILTAGLLGDQFVGLVPGPSADMIAAGGKITRTQSAVVLENLIGSFINSRAAEAGSGGSQ